MIHELLIKQSLYSTYSAINKNGEGVCRFHALTHLSEPTRTYFPKSSANTPSRDCGHPRTPTNELEQPISRRISVWRISSRAQSGRFRNTQKAEQWSVPCQQRVLRVFRSPPVGVIWMTCGLPSTGPPRARSRRWCEDSGGSAWERSPLPSGHASLT